MAAQIGASAAAARAHEELYAYWSGLRHGPQLPGRGDIRPEDFKRLLPTVSLIDVRRDPLDFRLRLAGTGRCLTEVYNSTAAEYWRTELTKLVHDRRPAVGVHNLAWRGAAHLSILWLRLPLATNGKDVDMIMGYDAVVGVQGDTISGIRAA